MERAATNGQPGSQAPRDIFIFVESNTSGTGEVFLQLAYACGLVTLFLTRHPSRYEFLERAAGVEMLECDTSDITAILEAIAPAAAGRRIVGVFSTSEYYIAIAADVARSLGLPSNPPGAVAKARDKSIQRRLVSAAAPGLCPRYATVGNARDAQELAAKIGFPVVVKPTSGSGSVNVRRCDSPDDIDRHAAKILGAGCQTMLVEEMIFGQEVSVELFNGKAVGVTLKQLGPLPYFVEIGHVFPDDLDAGLRQRATSAAEQVARILDIGWGPAHVELKLSASGPKLIELNPRLAGDMIPELIRLSTGQDLITATIHLAAGRPAMFSADRQNVAAIGFVMSERNGTLHGIDGLEAARTAAEVVAVKQLVPNGARLVQRGESGDRLAYVIVLAADHRTARRALGDALSGIGARIGD